MGASIPWWEQGIMGAAPVLSPGDVTDQASSTLEIGMLASALSFLLLPLAFSWQLFLSHSPSDAMSLFGCNDYNVPAMTLI